MGSGTWVSQLSTCSGHSVLSHPSKTDTHRHTHRNWQTPTPSSWTAGWLTFSSGGKYRECELGEKQQQQQPSRRHDGIKYVSTLQCKSTGYNFQCTNCSCWKTETWGRIMWPTPPTHGLQGKFISCPWLLIQIATFTFKSFSVALQPCKSV